MTAPIYNFPDAYELQRIERLKLPRRTAASPFFEIMPFDSSDSHLLEWEQGDLYRGYQQWRGLNNRPLTVNRVGARRFISEPGVYGEKIVLREDELTRRRAMAAMSGAAGPIDVSDLVAQAHEQLLDRRLTLILKIVSDLLITGSFTVANIDGTTVNQGSYTQQQQTPSVAWNDLVNSKPLADMRNYRLLEYGQDVTFRNAPGAKQLMSVATVNALLNNQNPDDLGGKKLGYGTSINSAADLNKIFIDNDIPPIEVVTDGYFRQSDGAYTRWVPDGKVLVVGKRTSGVRTGFYRFTRNINSPNAAAQPYVRVRIDENIPSHVEVHDGHNGGPVLQYPGALILVNAF